MTSAPPAPEPPVAEWRAAAVRYPYAQGSAVGPVDLTVASGERVLLLGPSGCGKSTLLLTLTGLIPKSIPAEIEGDIRIEGEPATSREPAAWAGKVAHFFQDADQTLCGMRVEDEIAFALENRALPEAEIATRVVEAMRRVGLPEDWRQRRTMTLSGGEKQLVALAATLAQEAGLFIADEPTAHLAPEAARRLHDLLISGDRDHGVLIVDHRLDHLIGAIDRVVAMDGVGRILAEGPPRAVFRENHERLSTEGIWCPLAAHLDAALRAAGVRSDVASLTMAETLTSIDAASTVDSAKARSTVAAFVAARSVETADGPADGRMVARLSGVSCAPFLGPVVLRNVDLGIREGEVLGILGPNGAGKTTLAACLAGVLRPKTGKREGAVGGIAFQKPETQFTEGSVREEIASVLGRLEGGALEDRTRNLLADWGLEGLEARHPFELSQGQKRRLALATLTADDRWPLIVLDEPLAGLDARGAAQVEADIARLGKSGRAVAVVTHDMDFALKVCPRSIVVGEGGILADGPTRDLLADAALLARARLAAPELAPAMAWLQATREAAPC